MIRQRPTALSHYAAKALAAVTALTLNGPTLAADWPHWRGPDNTGAVRENAPVTSWSLEGENLLWKAPVGGRTTPIVLNGRVYLIGPAGEGATLHERVICLNADSGQTVWEQHFNVFHTDIVENRVGWTSLTADPATGNLYAHATGGELVGFDRDGKILWKHSLTEEFGRVSGYGGRLHNPVIDEDRVIISMTCSSWGEFAKPAHRYYAFDKHTGAAIWTAAPGEPPNDTSCGTATIAVIGGKRLLLAPNVDGRLYALLSRTGETIWKFHVSNRPLNTTPVVDGNRVYIGHSEENIDTTVMGRVVCIKGDADGGAGGDITASGEVWRADGIDAGYASPAVANGRLYVVDNGARLFALDAKTGKQHWRHALGTIARGSPVVTADGVIYVGEVNGVFHILRDAGDKCEELDKQEFAKRDDALDEMQGTPAVADGRVYFQTRYETYCLGEATERRSDGATKGTMPARSERDAQASESANASADDAAVHLPLMLPEATVAPGEEVDLAPFGAIARLRSPESSLLKIDKLNFSVQGAAGKIDETGTFVAGRSATFSAGTAKAKVDEKELATARIRICPKPPFKVDFEEMEIDSTPPGWLNVIGKTKVIERDGGKVLQKLAEKPAPPFMRIRTYMCPPIKGSQSIRADLLGTSKKPFWKPDMGLVSCRYELLMMGDEPDNPRLRIVSWAPLPRVQKDEPFKWEPETWYTMLLQVEQREKDAVIRGKVWPRGETEPSVWNIEVVDPLPNREGSPALYAYSAGTTAKSKGTEVFFDNVEVKSE